MAEETAVLEAPVVEEAGESTESFEQHEGETVQHEQIDNADSPQPGETGHLRGSELYKNVKEKLKAAGLDAKELRSIRNAIHIADKADKLSGGNLESIEKSQGLVARLSDNPESGYTPEQIIEETLQERTFWRDYDNKFQSGDASLISQMLDANPESFQKLVPAAFDEYFKVNPEAASSYVAKSAVGYLNGEQVPLQWAIMDTFLPAMPDFPGKDRFVAAIQAVYKSFQGLESMATRAVEIKKTEGQKADTPADGKTQSLEQREMSLNMRDWNTEAAPKGVQMRDAEMNRIAAGQKVTLTDEDKARIRTAVREEVDARLGANRKYGEAMQGYLKAGNKAEYVKRAHSEYEKLVPGATSRHTQAVIDAKKAEATKKPVVKPNGQPATKSEGGNLDQWLTSHPKTLGMMIDHSNTTRAMLQSNRAYIVGKKGVYKWPDWPDQVN